MSVDERPGDQRAGVVRAARVQDLDRVAELWSAITDHHAHLDPLFTMREDAAPALRELLTALMGDRYAEILVYDVDGDLPGMCIVRIDRAPAILEEVERAEITDLGVRESFRRRGIGRALVVEALRWVEASGVSRVEVQVAHGNNEGQGFWRAAGFDDFMDVLHKRL